MKKLIKSAGCVLLCVALLASLYMPVSAAVSGSCGENLTWRFSSSTGKLTISGSGEMDDFGYYSIPWAEYFDSITSLSLPEGLTYIGRYAFDYAVNLKSVTFPDSLAVIGSGAFSDCPLESITFGTGLQAIEIYAFEKLKVKNLVLPEGLVSVGSLEGDGVQTLSIPSTLLQMGEYSSPMLEFPSLKSVTVAASNPAFAAADGILYTKDKTRVLLYPSRKGGTTLVLPDTVTDISCISGCEGITELTLPAFVTDYSGLRLFRMFPNVEIVHVPDTVCNLDGAFMDCAKLKTVNIPAGISSLDSTFSGCTSLTTVELPSSVVNMTHAFTGCTALTSVNIPAGVTKLDYCFDGCTALTSATVPASVETMACAFTESGLTSVTLKKGLKTVSAGAFSQSRLTSVTIPDSVTALEPSAFFRTPLESVTFGSGLEIIDENCFYGCDGLTSLHLPANLTYIGDRAFYDVWRLTDVTAGNKLTYIGRDAFTGMNFGEWSEDGIAQYLGQYLLYAAGGDYYSDEEYGDTEHNNHLRVREGTTLFAAGAINNYYEVIFPESMTAIPDNAFQYCNIQKVRLPETLTAIGANAFRKSSVNAINLPEALERIDDYAFLDCEALTEITLPKNLSYLGALVFYNSGYYNTPANWKNGFLYLNQALLNTDKDTVKASSITVKAGTKLIGGYAMENLPVINVTLPEGLTQLGKGAFCRCGSLNSVNLPASVTDIGFEAFYECKHLYHLTLPAGLQTLGECCFQSCGIRELDIPAGVTELPKELFKWAQIRRISLPEGLTTLGDDVFWGCAYLTEITLPAGITEIPRFTFYNVPLTEIEIPAGVTAIGEYAFSNTLLESIALPAGLKSIGGYCFDGCGRLKSVSLPSGLKTVGECAFLNCDALKSVYMHSSLNYIGAHAYGYSWNYNSGSSYYILRDDVRINGSAGTAGERYAIANGIPFNTKPVAKQTVFSAAAVSTAQATVKVSAATVKAGEPVSVTVTPKSGWQLFAYVAVDETGASLVSVNQTDCENTFTMPESNCFCSAVCIPKQSGHTHDYPYAMCADTSDHWRQCACGSVSDKAAHSFRWVVDYEPYGDTAGRKHEQCTVCGYCRKLNTVIPATGDTAHEHIWYSESDALCHWTFCNCGALGQREEHTYVWVLDWPADGQYTGWKHQECSVCGYSKDDGVEIPVIGKNHTHSYTMLSRDESGHWKECACGARSKVTAHSLKWVTTAVPTATEDGLKCKRCTVCGYNADETVIPKLVPGHNDCPAADYSDAPKYGNWAHAGIDFCIDRGIMGSTRTDVMLFEPATACSRAMIVSVLYRLAGSPAVNYTAKFPDVTAGKWYTGAVIWAYQNGIVAGYSNGKFGPNDMITREQMAVILKGYVAFTGGKTTETGSLSSFADASKVTWSKDAVKWAVAAGIISGKAKDGKTYLDPQGNATRQEVASILMRFCEHYKY